MDGLSIAASIAGLVSVADLIFRTTSRYVKRVKGARHEVEDLLAEVKHFSILLHNLSLVAYELENPPSTDNALPLPPANLRLHYIHDCRKVLNRLDKGLESLKSDIESTSALGRFQGRMKWPFSSTETQEMVQSIRHQKETITLAISADSFSQLKQLLSRQDDATKRLNAVQTTVKEILDIETRIILNQVRREVLEFFTKEANPRPDFEMNKKLRHPLTGIWFTESLEFQEWRCNAGSKIWITGIPGAGKSVLAGAIIMECLQVSSMNDKVASAYFFCSYKDGKTFLAKNILSSLASQIARQNEAAFQILQEYYEELRSHKHLPGEPSSERLLEILTRMSTLFDQVFIIVDGLDECDTDTDDVVHDLVNLSISQSEGIITTALLSRDELSIRHQLELEFEIIDIEAKTEDIQLYVASELEKRTSSKKLRFRDLSLKDQIMTQLVNGAKGMFRWVACQLDHLCELPTDRARREALTKLPPTLPASYERILHRVENSPNEVQRIVRRSLQLIALDSGRNPLTIQQMCEAVSVSFDEDTFEDDEVVDSDDIMRWCSSLIRKSADCRSFQFAHYSVVEFLEGICSTHPHLDSYHVSDGKGNSLLTTICLRYLTFQNYERPPIADITEIQRMRERNIARPFYQLAAIWWPLFFWRGLGNGNGNTQRLLYTLFDIKKTESFNLWSLELVRHCLSNNSPRGYFERDDFGRDESTALTMISAIIRPDFTPLHMASALGLFDVCGHLIKQGARIDISSRFGTPLHCALGGVNIFNDREVFEYFVAYVGTPSGISLPTARHQTIQTLLAAGANTSLHFVSPFRQTTILSLALYSVMSGEDFEMVASLVSAGIKIEEDDLELIDDYYRDAINPVTPERLKTDFAGGKGIVSLLEALGAPEDDESSPRSRLYALTLNVAKAMRLASYASLPNVIPGDLASEDDLQRFAVSTIESNDVATMEQFIKSGRLEFLKAADFSKIGLPVGWSALHICIDLESIDILNLLLEAGCDVKVAADDGTTPAHLCNDDKCRDLLRSLIQHGASTIAQDGDQYTIWHTCVLHYCTQTLEMLIELDQNKDAALMMQTGSGYTPICLALLLGDRDTVQLLLHHCVSAEYWKGDIPFFQKAAKLGSAHIVQALLDMKIPLDSLDSNTGSPLHFLAVDATIECTKLLVKVFPHCHVRCREGRTPFESLLVRSIGTSDEVDTHMFMELLGGFELPQWQQRERLWPSVCSMIIPHVPSANEGAHWLKQLLFRLLEFGVAKAYEEEHLISALLPFANELESTGNKLVPRANKIRQGEFSEAPGQPMALRNWSWFSQVLIELANKTLYWDNMLAQPSTTHLLSWSIIHDDTGLIDLLLKRGVNIHNRVDALSPLELACIPEIAISEDNFARLLSCAERGKLQETYKRVLGLRLLRLTGTLPFQDRGLWKMKQLLDAGVDYNSCSSPPLKRPALLYHITGRSFKTCMALIDRGADPWLADSNGFDAALIAVSVNNSAILKKIAQVTAQRNLVPMWKRTWKSMALGSNFTSGGNAIHLAASCNAIECLEFYVKEGVLHNLETLDDDMQTPMHYAARYGNVVTIEFLKRHGCSIDVVAGGGITPLHLAIQFKNLYAVKVLLELGSELRACSLGMTPLAYAYEGGDVNIIKLLQSYKGQEGTCASPNHYKGLLILVNAFCAAIDRNDIRMCEDLHRQGCPVDFELSTPWRVTPLMMALCNRKSPKVVEWLLGHGAIITAMLQGNPMPPYIAVIEAAVFTPVYNDLLPLLLTRFFEQGGNLLRFPCSLIHVAVKNRNYKGLRVLLEQLRCKYNVLGALQRQHQHHMTDSAAEYRALINRPSQKDAGRAALHEAAVLNNIEDAEQLIANGADVDLSTYDGSTPLHCAAENGSEKVAELLLKHGARLEPVNNWGNTPLMRACACSHLNTIKLLLGRKGPSIHRNYYGNNLLGILSYQQFGKPDEVTMWNLLCNKGVHSNQANCVGQTAIHHLLRSPCQLLLRHSMREDPTMQWVKGVEWAMSQSDESWHTTAWGDINTITSNYRIIQRCATPKRYLRISTSVTTGQGSIFHLAASVGSVEALENLLTIGADLEQEIGHHGTALTISAANGRLEAVQYLFRKTSRTISNQNEVIGSAILAAADNREIIRWLLVTRHVDQRKISYSKLDSRQGDGRLQNWSGVRSFAVPLRWEWKQRRDESMVEYARRRRKIVRSLQGKVAK